MKTYYELRIKKSWSSYSPKDELSVIVRYYFQGKKLNTSTGVLCKVKDWDREWRNRVNKSPIKSSDPDHKEKNLKIKQKLIEVRNITEKIQKDDLIPSVDLVKSYLRENKVSKVKKSLKKIHFLVLFEMYGKWVNSDNFINSKSYVLTLNPPIKDVVDYTIEYQLKHKGFLKDGVETQKSLISRSDEFSRRLVAESKGVAYTRYSVSDKAYIAGYNPKTLDFYDIKSLINVFLKDCENHNIEINKNEVRKYRSIGSKSCSSH